MSSRGSKVFRPTPGDEGIKTLSPNDSSSLTQSTSRSSPFFQIRLVNKSCHSFQSKSSQTPDPLRIQGPSKTKSWPLYPVSSVKERNRKGGKCKISRVLQSPVPSTKPHLRWRPVIDLNRLNTFLHVEKFKMETPESIRTSLIPGEWVSSIDLSDTYPHIPIHPNSRKYLRFCYKSQVFQFTSLPFGLATAPPPPPPPPLALLSRWPRELAMLYFARNIISFLQGYTYCWIWKLHQFLYFIA